MMVGFTVLLLTVSMAAAAFAAGEEQQEKFGSKVGGKLAPFSLPDPTTDKSYGVKELAAGGKDVALVFMQSACTLCDAEISEFVGASDELQGKLNVALVCLRRVLFCCPAARKICELGYGLVFPRKRITLPGGEPAS